MQDNYNERKQKLILALAEIVRAQRLLQGKSISKISAEIMMTKSLWQNLESGKKDPQFSTLWRVCEALNISLADLDIKIKKKLGQNYSLTGIFE